MITQLNVTYHFHIFLDLSQLLLDLLQLVDDCEDAVAHILNGGANGARRVAATPSSPPQPRRRLVSSRHGRARTGQASQTAANT